MTQLTGTENLFIENQVVASVNDFWSWSGSNLLSNTYRGMLAEFIVARSLNLDCTTRVEWELYDLLYKDVKIEVKSTAFVQSWEQIKLSNPRFDIHKSITKNKRCSDVYIFCLLKEKSKKLINPLDLKQWSFYILTTEDVDNNYNNQKSVGLEMIKQIAVYTDFNGIKNCIDSLFELRRLCNKEKL